MKYAGRGEDEEEEEHDAVYISRQAVKVAPPLWSELSFTRHWASPANLSSGYFLRLDTNRTLMPA